MCGLALHRDVDKGGQDKTCISFAQAAYLGKVAVVWPSSVWRRVQGRTGPARMPRAIRIACCTAHADWLAASYPWSANMPLFFRSLVLCSWYVRAYLCAYALVAACI